MTKDDPSTQLRAEAGNVKKRAFRDIQKLSRSFIGLLLIAEDLAAIGDIEEAAATAKAELAAAQKQHAEQLAAVAQTRAMFAQVEHGLRENLTQVRAELEAAEAALAAAVAGKEQAIAEADREAAARAEASTMDALAIVAAARDAGAVVLAQAEALATRREEEADALVTQRRVTLAQLNLDIAADEAKLADIRATIAKYAAT